MSNLVKTIKHMGFIGLFVGLFLNYSSRLEGANKTLRLISNDWCPYVCSNNEKLQKKPGFAWEIVKKALTSQGYRVTYTDMPYSRAIREAKTKHFNGIVGVFKSEVPDFIFHHKPISNAQMCFFTTDKNWHYKGPLSLHQKVLGFVDSYTFDPEVDAYINLHRYNPARVIRAYGENPLPRLIKMLIQNRIQVLIDDMYVAHALISKFKGAKIYRRKCFAPHPLFVSFNPTLPSSAKLAADLDRGLSLIKSRGDIDKIMSTYIIDDSQINAK